MTNTNDISNSRTFFKNLPDDLDDEQLDAIDRLPSIDSPALEDEIEQILVSDALVLKKLHLLLAKLNWSEKMAVGIVSYWLIDKGYTQLVKLTPRHGEFSVPIKQAIEFLEQLSPVALAEIAEGILQEDFEIAENNNAEN